MIWIIPNTASITNQINIIGAKNLPTNLDPNCCMEKRINNIPITMGMVAALLIALPTFLKTATETLFGGSSQKTTADGGQMRSIQ